MIIIIMISIFHFKQTHLMPISEYPDFRQTHHHHHDINVTWDNRIEKNIGIMMNGISIVYYNIPQCLGMISI